MQIRKFRSHYASCAVLRIFQQFVYVTSNIGRSLLQYALNNACGHLLHKIRRVIRIHFIHNISKLFVGKSIYQLLLQHGFHFNENIRRRFLWQKAKKHEQPLRRLITKNHGNICRVNG